VSRRAYSSGERVAAVAFFAGLIAIVAALFVPVAVSDFLGTEEEIEGLRARYVELARRQRDLDALAARRDALRATDPQKFGLLVADTIDLARAEIQNALQGYATESGAVIAQVRAVEAEAPSQVSAQISVQVPADALPAFLARIAGSEPPLFVDEMDIRSARRRRVATAPEVLAVDLTLSAYVSIAGGGQTR